MLRRTITIAIFLVATAPGSFAADQPAAIDWSRFFFREGHRVLFLGDSITEQYQYSSYMELYLTTRFPTGLMTFINAGIGGDTAAGGLRRFADHVLAEKPNALTINFGMNDGGYGGFNVDRHATYLKSIEAMVESAKKTGCRVALISPNAVEVRSAARLKTYVDTQAQFYAPLKEIAARQGVWFVDQYAVTRKVLEKLASDEAKVRPFPDGIHTNPAGGLLMAHTILVGLGAPRLVSDATIEASGMSKGTGCHITDVKAGPEGVSFDRNDDAIPMPVLKEWRDLLPYVSELKDLNYYGLTVKGLAAGKYTLTIDGQEAATFTAEELAAGVNLGLLDRGPLYEQGLKVYQAITEKNKLVHQRFRSVRMFQAPDWLIQSAGDVITRERDKELAKRAEQIALKQAEIYKLAELGIHRFELKVMK